MSEHKFEKLSRDKEANTRINVGHTQFTVEQLEKEIKSNSSLGKKLKSVENQLDIQE